MERTEQEQGRLDGIIDALGPLEFFAAMHECHGPRRCMELVGWAVIWGLLGVESVSDMRRRYEEAGLKRSAAYLAASDYKLFADFLLKKYGREFEMKEILRGLANVRPANRIL